MAELVYPHCTLLLLCGPSGSGKSTFAARHFRPSQIVSTDVGRAMVLDDRSSQAANDDVTELLLHWVELRLRHRRFTVVDSTALRPTLRNRLIALAGRWRTPVHVLAFDIPLDECLRRDTARPDRTVGERVVRRHRAQFEGAMREIATDGHIAGIVTLSPGEQDEASVHIAPSCTAAARFDVIGDVHGCADELRLLLSALGYVSERGVWRHPDNRIPVFVGDLTDRGPDSPGVLRIVCDLVAADAGLMTPGNHDDKLFRLLRGQRIRPSNGLELTMDQFDRLPSSVRNPLIGDVLALLAPSPMHHILDNGALVIAHAGLRDDLIGASTGEAMRFALYGDVAGMSKEGNPIRRDWASQRPERDGRPFIVYGHTPQAEVRIAHDTVNVDGGCVYGGSLAALRWPEREVVTVPARRAHATRVDFIPTPDN